MLHFHPSMYMVIPKTLATVYIVYNSLDLKIQSTDEAILSWNQLILPLHSSHPCYFLNVKIKNSIFWGFYDELELICF